MPKPVVKGFILIAGNYHPAFFNPKGISIVIIQRVSLDLGVPPIQIFAVE